MTQFARPSLVAATDDGITLSTKFNGALTALYTNHAGAAAPPSPEKGQVWIDTSQEAAGTPTHVMRIYTGSVWRTLGTLNLTTGLYTTAVGLPLTGGTLTGPIQGQDGTAALPGYAFSGNANLGMFRVSANSLGFSTSGVQRIALTGTSFDVSVGTFNFTGASASLNLERATGAAGWSQINFRTGTSNRWQWQMAGVESTGNAGSNLTLTSFDDAGATLAAFLQLDRAGRRIGINGPQNSTAVISVRSSDGALVAWDGLDLLNLSTAADAYAGINLRTSSGALRGAIRGERPGASNNGDIGIWTGVTGVLSKAATFRSNGNLEVVGNVLSTGVRFSTTGDYSNVMSLGWNGTEPRVPFSVGGAQQGFLQWSDNIRFTNLGSGLFNIAAIGGTFWSINLNPSDRRLKDNIEPTKVDALADILAIETFSFDWKVGTQMEGKPHQPIGFVADNLKEIASECVNTGGSFETVDLLPLVARLTKAIQQQQEMISTLTSRIAALEASK